MEQQELKETCWFCGSWFTNFEEMVVENFNIQEEQKLY